MSDSTRSRVVRRYTLALAVAAVWAASPVAPADVKYFRSTTPESFKQGTAEHLATAAGGELQLGTDYKSMELATEAGGGSIGAVRIPLPASSTTAPSASYVTYVTAEGGMKLARSVGTSGRSERVFLPDGVGTITALAAGPHGELLLAGTSSGEAPEGSGSANGGAAEQASVWSFDEASGQWKRLWGDAKAAYVWTILPAADGSIYLGTGGSGSVVKIAAEKATTVLKLDKGSVLSLALDAGRNLLYVGTEPRGLVYQLATTGDAPAKVLFDADQPDIIGLLVASDGRLVVAASVGTDRNHDGGEPSGGDTPGSMNGTAPSLPTPPTPEPPPEIPQPPQPNPAPDAPKRLGEPTSPPKFFMVLPEADGQHPTKERAGGSPFHDLEKALRSLSATSRPSASDEKHVAQPTADGSAVYLVGADGVPLNIYRTGQPIDAIAWRNGNVAVAVSGTGDDDNATLWEVPLTGGPATDLLKVGCVDIPSIQTLAGGSLLLAGSERGVVVEVAAGVAKQGTWTSPVLDARLPARFGTLRLEGVLPAATTVMVSARSGTTSDPAMGNWSEWSVATPAARFNAMAVPAGRFVQYRLELAGDGKVSPAIEEAHLAYQQANVPPQIRGVTVTVPGSGADGDSADAAGPSGHDAASKGSGSTASADAANLSVNVEAEDPNDDQLAYSLEIRALPSTVFTPLAKEQPTGSFDLDPARLADGRYQLRATVTDAPSNAAGQAGTSGRLSRIFVIDRTPPVLGPVTTQPGEGVVTLSATVTDATSTVSGVEWAVDTTDHWQNAEAADTMFDSPQETVRVTLRGLATGGHVVYLRLRDSTGNVVVRNVVIEVGKSAAGSR